MGLETLRQPYARYTLDSVREGDLVRVQVSGAANVLLLDDAGFSAYVHGMPFNYVGGAKGAGAHLLGVKATGRVHVVIDLGGRAGNVAHRVEVTRRDKGRRKRA